MSKRTTIQLALLLIGLIVWGYGQRVDDPSLRLVGITFFALATMLRLFRKSGTHRDDGSDEADSDDGSHEPP